MTQYNTGNDVPSSGMPDAWDNNATIDIFVNSPDLSVITRTGIERDTIAGIQQKSADQREQIATDGAAVVESTRQNLIPLSRQYMTLAAAQADIANIPAGSTTYYRSPDDNALAIEVINNAGTLEPTGRKMPSQTTVDNLSTDVSTLNERVTDIATQAQASEMLGGIVDKKGRVPLWVNSKGDTILKKDINITQIGEEYPETRENASTALGYGIQETDRKFSGGIVDALGRLMVGFDFKGNMYIKGESLEELIAGSGSNKYINGNALSVSAFGDSLTFGAGTGSPPNGWVEQISVLMPEMNFRKFAVGGQVSSEIATRQGGFVNLLTIQGNTIPASGPVNVTAQKYRPITVNSAGAGQANLKGTLFGVHGTLNATYDGSGNMLTNTFTRTNPGDAVYVDPESAFILDSNDSEFDIQILWPGRNDVYATDFPDRVLSVHAACGNHVKPLNKKIIRLSITNRTGSSEVKGSKPYNDIIAVNKSVQALYPRDYFDLRALMVRSYNPDIPQDVIDFNNDCMPSSLMYDDTHFNAAGYAIIAQAIKKIIVDRGWNE
ncbi:TPA: hypothetical protein ACTY9I_002125 [Raoultella planticola]